MHLGEKLEVYMEKSCNDDAPPTNSLTGPNYCKTGDVDNNQNDEKSREFFFNVKLLKDAKDEINKFLKILGQ